MLQDQAMIANLQIRCWTARKLDKTVSFEVDAAHQANGAGNYNKLLVDKAALDPLSRHGGKIRDYHYKSTLPWGDNGDRLLPAKAYLDYTRAMRDLKQEAERLKSDFLGKYPALVAGAQAHLGTLYDPRDYPSAQDIANRFGVTVEFLPVPDAADFRVDVAKADADEIRAQILETVAARQLEATRECWRRLKDVIDNLAVMMAKEKPVFRDTLVGNIEELVALLPKLNVTEDKALDKVCKDITRWLASGVTPSELRKNPKLREDALARASEFLKRISPNL